MKVIKTIRCDLTSNTPAMVDAMAGDRESRVIACSLYNGYEPYNPPEDVTGTVVYTAPGGVKRAYDTMEDGVTPAVTVKHNIAAVILSEMLLSKAGSVCVSVVLRSSDGAQLTTFPFRVSVTAPPGISGAENMPSMGAGFAGKIFYGDEHGNISPLGIGEGLCVEDGVLVQEGADAKGAAESAVRAHNVDTAAHNDLRQELKKLSDRLTAFFDSDDTTLDELSELIAYIKSNKTLIDAITTSKVSVADIVDNLTTNVSNQPLSAAQGVALKMLIDGLSTGKLDAEKLQEAVDGALAQAKESGEFDGAPGKTPVAGTDYFTAADKTEMVEAVLAALPKYEGGAY